MDGWSNNEKHLSDPVRIYDDILLSTFWVLTIRKHTNMNASIYITDLCPWDGEFLYSSFCLLHILLANVLFHTYLQSCFITFPLITSFIHPITELPQIYTTSAQTHQDEVRFIIFFPLLPLLPCCLREPASSQAVWAGDLVGNGGHSAEVPRRITLCLNSLACHHKKDAYGWLPFFPAYAYGCLSLRRIFFLSHL